MRLTGMADAFRKQMEDVEMAGLSFEERFGLLVDQPLDLAGESGHDAPLEEIQVGCRALCGRHRLPAPTADWTGHDAQSDHLAVGGATPRGLFTGPTGIGKSWLAQALAQKACRDGYTVLYRPAAKLFRDLAIARADGSLGRVLDSIARTDVLVVDDFAMAPLNEQERRDFLEICDDRYSRRSTILTSQLPVESGMRRSAIPPWQTASSTGWFTTPIALNCRGNPFARRKTMGTGRPAGGGV